MKAHIISVGTELLLGEVVNTNASVIARELKNIGISVYHINTVGDNENRLLKELENAYEDSDIIITTGGLGPTKDDLTKEVIAKSLGVPMVFDENEFEKLKKYFKHKEKDLNEGNLTQASFPQGYKILENPNGTASGCIIEKNEKIIIVMPGPPREIQPMLKNYVVPFLQKFSNLYFSSKTVNVIGIGESVMEELVMPLITSQQNPTIAPYFKEKSLTLRIMSSADKKEKADELIYPTLEKVKDILGENVYGIGEDISIEDVVGKYLIENNISISIAESCTGGMISSRLINIAGISKCFKQGYITYSNDSKVKLLNVDEDTLNKYGAVSEEVAREMARGAALSSNSDIGLSSTGIAGPDGGTKEKPVGLVYIGLYKDGKTYCQKHIISGKREIVRNRASALALDFVRRNLNIPIYEF